MTGWGAIAFGGMQMRRIITFAIPLGITFMLIGGSMPGGQAAEAVTAAAHRGTVHAGTVHRVAGAAMKRVRFGGYTLEVPAGWPVYLLARDPGRCVRYDQHAVYLGRPGADQQCPAHLVGRTETISVQADPGPAAAGPVYGSPVHGGPVHGGRAYGGPVISGPPGPGGTITGDPSGNLVHASLARAGLSITGTYAGSPREVLSIIRSITRAGQAPTRHGAAGLVMAGSARALPAGPARAV